MRTLSKHQRLKSRKTISMLFDQGDSAKAYPLRALYRATQYNEESHTSHLQIAVIVPKRSFRKAVDRNRIKRQIREAYRLHYAPLHAQCIAANCYLAIMIIYVDKSAPDYHRLEAKMIKIIKKLQTSISNIDIHQE